MPEQTDQVIPTQETSKFSLPGRKLSRRSLLVSSAVGVATAPFIGAQLERVVLAGFSKGLGTTDSLINNANALVEVAKEDENSNARPMHKLIETAVSSFEGKSGRKARYVRSTDYRDKEYYTNVLDKLASTILPKKPGDILEELKKSIPGDASLAYMSSDNRITAFPDIYASGSGLYERFKERHPDLFKTNNPVLSVESIYLNII